MQSVQMTDDGAVITQHDANDIPRPNLVDGVSLGLAGQAYGSCSA